jgi:hypothetical protein
MPHWSSLYLEEIGDVLLWLALIGIGFCLGYLTRSYVSYRRRHVPRRKR